MKCPNTVVVWRNKDTGEVRFNKALRMSKAYTERWFTIALYCVMIDPDHSGNHIDKDGIEWMTD